MGIEHFVAQSEGEWKSMRSGHSLAFQQFEQIVSTITIQTLYPDNPKVIEIVSQSKIKEQTISSPFLIEWEAESDWGEDERSSSQSTSGSSIFVPIPSSEKEGIILRSVGYAENIPGTSQYYLLPNNLF